MENKIDFIDPYSNDNFSNMTIKDKNDILICINSFLLEFREKLNFSNNETFGVELEYEKYNKINYFDFIEIIGEYLANFWEIKTDITLIRGGEVTSPILSNNQKNWLNLFNICIIMNKYCKNSSGCGGHIHIGSKILGTKTKSWLNFINIWSAYEHVIYRFLYGVYLCGRKGIDIYARPISDEYSSLYEYITLFNQDYTYEDVIDEIFSFVNYTRNVGVNMQKLRGCCDADEGRTIEFRSPNNCYDPVIWQNNINFLVKLLEYCSSSNFNFHIVNERRKNNEDCGYSYNEGDYNKIYLDDAIELSDLIFDKNIDKVYFLRQYLKNFQVSDKYRQARLFTKKYK